MAFYLIAVLRLRESIHAREIVFFSNVEAVVVLAYRCFLLQQNGRDTRTRHVRFRKGRKMYGGGVRPKLSNL